MGSPASHRFLADWYGDGKETAEHGAVYDEGYRPGRRGSTLPDVWRGRRDPDRPCMGAGKCHHGGY